MRAGHFGLGLTKPLSNSNLRTGVMLWMRKVSFSPVITKATKALKAVGRRCSILRPEEVKGDIWIGFSENPLNPLLRIS